MNSKNLIFVAATIAIVFENVDAGKHTKKLL